MKKDEHIMLTKIYNDISDFINTSINVGYDSILEENKALEKTEKALKKLKNLICKQKNTFEIILNEI